MTVNNRTKPAAVCSRRLALILAAALSMLITAWPGALVSEQGPMDHGLMSLLMLGIAAGFVYGVGYRPEARLWRWLFGPLPALGLMAAGLLWMLVAHGAI